MRRERFKEAVQAYEAGRLLRADQLFARLEQEQGESGRVAYYRGLVKWYLGDRKVALEFLQQAVAARPRRAEFQKTLGQCRLTEGDLDGAIFALEQAFRCDRANEEVCFALGNALLLKRDFKRAEQVYRTALRRHRRSLSIICNLAGALREQGRLEAAVAELERALKIDPSFADAAFNLGVLHHMMADHVRATRAFERCLALNHNHALTHAALTMCCMEQSDEEAAQRHLALALTLGPHVPDVRWTNFIYLMRHNDLAAGWDEFEWRWKARESPAAMRTFSLEHWDGAPLAGRRLLIWQEQGIGDEIMFASLLNDEKLRDGQMTVLCNERLRGLFSRAFSHVNVISDEQEAAEMINNEALDLQSPAGSLCRYLRPSRAGFPQEAGYLEALPEAVQRIGSALAMSADTHLRVGISWRSGNPFEGRRRSIGLDQLAPLLAQKGCRFFNLQYGEVSDELMRDGQSVEFLPDTDITSNMENLAGLISNMDLVISVDNTTVHMSGALGKPTWVLLPASADWRWFDAKESSPWYPTVRLFHQTRPGDWQDVISKVQAELGMLVSRRASQSDDQV